MFKHSNNQKHVRKLEENLWRKERRVKMWKLWRECVSTMSLQVYYHSSVRLKSHQNIQINTCLAALSALPPFFPVAPSDLPGRADGLLPAVMLLLECGKILLVIVMLD
jgi:hypothetical protein